MKKKTKIIIISCIILVYCVYLFVKLLANPIDIFIVEQGKIYKEESQTGYIIRDEQIIESAGLSWSRKNGSIEIRGKESCKW